MNEPHRTASLGTGFVSIVTSGDVLQSSPGGMLSRPVQIDSEPPNEEVGFQPGLTAIGPTTQRKAREWALVLQSSDTWHLVRWTPSGFILLVRDADYEAAATSIDRYEAENKDFPPRRTREQARFAPSLWAPMLFAALALFFVVTGPVALYSGWFVRGTAVSSLVLSHEPWRAVTALTLHADTSHIVGNAISGTIFASAVHRRLGPGGGTLAILASGIAGNVANAVYHLSIGQGFHRSIGASTAIFGAVGLLAATQLFLNRRKESGERGFFTWAAPIVGGLALLGTLGASAKADLGAHLFGLLAGLVIGIVAGFFLRNKLGRPERQSGRLWWQEIVLGGVAMGIISGSWLLAAYA